MNEVMKYHLCITQQNYVEVLASLPSCVESLSPKLRVSLWDVTLNASDISCLFSFLERKDVSFTTLEVFKVLPEDTVAAAVEDVVVNKTTLTSLIVSNVQHGDVWASHVSRALKKNSSLSSLSFSHTHITHEGMGHISNVLHQNKSLGVVTMEGENLSSPQCIDFLRRCIEGSPSVTSWQWLSCNIGDDGAILIAEALQHNTNETNNQVATNLSMPFNQIGSRGANALFRALQWNPSVTCLNLINNEIGPGCALELLQLLKSCMSLKTLRLQGNKIGSDAGRALANGLIFNHTLTYLDILNTGMGPQECVCMAEALKLNWSLLTLLCRMHNPIGIEGKQALQNAMAQNGSITMLPEISEQVDMICAQNRLRHQRARQSIIVFLAIRKYRDTSFPKEMVAMIAKAVWKTKADKDSW